MNYTVSKNQVQSRQVDGGMANLTLRPLYGWPGFVGQRRGVTVDGDEPPKQRERAIRREVTAEGSWRVSLDVQAAMRQVHVDEQQPGHRYATGTLST